MVNEFEEVLDMTKRGFSRNVIEVEEQGIISVRKNINDSWSNVDPTMRIDTNLKRVVLYEERYTILAMRISEYFTERYGRYKLLRQIVEDPI